jgi:glycosyltransferase involved in cell wall biosynthesis
VNLFFALSSNDTTAYARGYLPGMFLRQRGHQVYFNIDWFDQMPYTGKEQTEEQIVAKLRQAEAADIVIMQRPTSQGALMQMFQRRNAGKKTVVDHDDLLDSVSTLSPFTAKFDTETINLLVAGASLVTTSTEYLKYKWLMQENLNTVAIPNGIDFSLYRANKEKHEKFRIGFIGTAAYLDNQAKFNLWEIAQLPNVQIVIFGMPEKAVLEGMKDKFTDKDYKIRMQQWKPFEGIENIEFHNHVPITEYPAKLASLNLDCAVIPRDDVAFNKSKSNIKFLECSALQIPVVAQHFLNADSPYDLDQAENSEEIMKLAGFGKPSFIDQITYLMNHEDEAAQMAERAYRYVNPRFDIRTTVTRWEENLSGLLSL